MQITLAASSGSISDVLEGFAARFLFNEEKLLDLTINLEYLVKLSIRELKEMNYFLAAKLKVTEFSTPMRNRKDSLASWIVAVVAGARELVNASEVIEPAAPIVESAECSAEKDYWCRQCDAWMDRSGFVEVFATDYQERLCKVCNAEVRHKFDLPTQSSKVIAAQPVETSNPDSTSGLIISFGKTLEFLPRKTVTRRTWKDVHAQKFISAFSQNKLLVRAFDKDPRYGGKQIGWCRLTRAPYQERLCDMPEEDLLAEGGMCDTIAEFVQRYFDGNPRLEVWVVRFEFIADLECAAEFNLVVASAVIAPAEPISEPYQSDVQAALFDEPLAQSLLWRLECPQCRHTVPKTYFDPIKAFAVIANQVDSPCPECGFIHANPKVEVLEPEKKPGFTISIVSDGEFTEERVSRLPSYLIARNGKLFKKMWHCIDWKHNSCDAGYVEIVSKHLSNIAVGSGLVIKLMAENLEVYQACIVGDPPPFLIHGGGVYKRDNHRLKQNLAVRYFQVISEYLLNIVVVA